jgi:hypothetical protein
MVLWARPSQTFDRGDLCTGHVNEIASALTRLRIVMAAHPACDHAVVHTGDEVHPSFAQIDAMTRRQADAYTDAVD